MTTIFVFAKIIFRAPFIAVALAGMGLPVADAADTVSAEFGAGESAQVSRVGVQWKWDRQSVDMLTTDVCGKYQVVIMNIAIRVINISCFRRCRILRPMSRRLARQSGDASLAACSGVRLFVRSMP